MDTVGRNGGLRGEMSDFRTTCSSTLGCVMGRERQDTERYMSHDPACPATSAKPLSEGVSSVQRI